MYKNGFLPRDEEDVDPVLRQPDNGKHRRRREQLNSREIEKRNE